MSRVSMRLTSCAAAALLAVTVLACSAGAALAAGPVYFTDKLTSSPVLAASQTPGAWYVDRFAPASFESTTFAGQPRLHIGIRTTDSAANRPLGFDSAFYNTQGRKLDIDTPTGSYIAADLYVGADWETHNRRSDLWATMFDASATVSAYPTFGFVHNNSYAPAQNGFRVFDQTVGWTMVPLPAGFTYGSWHNLRIELHPDSLQYLLDGKLVYTDTNISGSTTFGNMMLQAYNFGDENYDVYWDNVASHPIGWTEPLETPAKEVERISGKNRYATAAAAKNKLPDWGHSKDLVIASGDSRHQPDALTAAGLSGAYHAPLLLVPTNYLDADARAAIAAMPKGVRVHIVGAAPAVSTKVSNQIASIAGVKSVERISGADRYATAAAVAHKMKSVLGGAMPRSALLTNGESASLLLDPLVAGTVSVSRHYPILLLKKSSVPASTRSALASLRLSTRYIVGGPTAVSESVRKSISVTAENRIYGADVAGDAVAFAQHAKANGWLTGSLVGFAAAVPDAATGGVYMGAQGGPMLVVKPGSVPAVTADFLSANKASITGGYLFGGPPAVNELVRTQLRDAIN